MNNPISYQQFLKAFPTQKEACSFFRDHWKQSCPRCRSEELRQLRKNKPRLLYCPTCKITISAFHGTIMENTKTDIRYWFYLGYFFEFFKPHINMEVKKNYPISRLKEEMSAPSYGTVYKIYRRIESIYQSVDYDDYRYTKLFWELRKCL